MKRYFYPVIIIVAFFALMLLWFDFMDKQSPFQECVETHYFQQIEKSKLPAKELWTQAGEQCVKLKGE